MSSTARFSRPMSFDWSDPDARFIPHPYWAKYDSTSNITLVYRDPPVFTKYGESTLPYRVEKQRCSQTPVVLSVNRRSKGFYVEALQPQTTFPIM